MTIFSPKSVGRQDTRKSMSFADAVVREANLDAAVLGQPLFRDVELRHDLDARRDGIPELHRRGHDVVEQPVDAVPDPQLLLVRFDVDVARTLLDGRHQQHVHQLDDRRFFTLARQGVGADLLELLENLDLAVGDDRHVLEGLRGHFERAHAVAVGDVRVLPARRRDVVPSESRR